jgi:hypothetical protein
MRAKEEAQAGSLPNLGLGRAAREHRPWLCMGRDGGRALSSRGNEQAVSFLEGIGSEGKLDVVVLGALGNNI